MFCAEVPIWHLLGHLRSVAHLNTELLSVHKVSLFQCRNQIIDIRVPCLGGFICNVSSSSFHTILPQPEESKLVTNEHASSAAVRAYFDRVALGTWSLLISMALYRLYA